MKSTSLALIAASLVLAGAAAPASAADCSPEKILEIRSADEKEVVIDCRLNLDLSARETLTKRLRFIGSAASGSSLRCNGAVLNAKVSIESRAVSSRGVLVKDSYGYQVWDPPTNIALDACRINGYVHVRTGPDYSIPDDFKLELWRSSRDARPGSDHVARMRAGAPSDVRVTNSSIQTDGNAAVYIYQGVKGFQLVNSTIYGTAKSIAIYLDAESANALIKDNVISVAAPRELIAVDTSEGNRIINNRLENLLDRGGVFVFRNCGECHSPLALEQDGDDKICKVGTGNVRHTQPSHNEIINNVYTTGGNNSALKAGIWIGSQGGRPTYCNADSDVAFGSGASDYDHAHHNVVMQNQIIARSLGSSIIDDPWPNAYHNFVSRNLTTDNTVDREAGCFLRTGYSTDFLENDQQAAVIEGKGASACVVKACTDGIRSNVSSCSMTSVPFVATASNTNATASTVAKCPTGMTAVGVTAACDLEHGSITSAELASVDPGKLQVLTPSDQVSDGLCSVGGTSQSKGEVQLRGGPSVKELKATCRERDSDGGDCQIRGTLFCMRK